MTAGFILPEYLRDPLVHAGARLISTTPPAIETSSVQWAYALSFAPQATIADSDGTVVNAGRFAFDIEVTRGAIGVGWTNWDGTALFDERFVDRATDRVSLRIATDQRLGRIVFRNVDASGNSSQFVIRSAAFHRDIGAARYPVHVRQRHFLSERSPVDGTTGEVFDTDAALAINGARLEWLATSDLPVAGGRVLDVGAGVGHFTAFFRDRRCTVVAIDGRDENIAELRRRHPGVEAYVADAQQLDAARFGSFDVIHCFGLLYHLDSPVAALRRLATMCRGFMVLETMVCDSSRAVAVLDDETKAASQALQGLGTRPSPAFLALALNRVGFRYVYGASTPPHHAEFRFDWHDDLSTNRDGVALRCIFVASHAPLDLRSLTPLIE